MKRILTVTTVAIASLMLVACGSDTITQEEVNTEVETQESIPTGFYITVDGMDILIGETIENTVDVIGEEGEYFEAPSCAFVGTDYIYTYNDYTLTFNDESEEILLGAITFNNDMIETFDGAYIGLSKDDITEIYGNDFTGDDDLMVYTKNHTELRIILEEGQVISILIQLAV